MSESVVVITGATDGLGRVLSESLARSAAHTLILHGRSPERLEALADALVDTPATCHFVVADFAELAQVHRLADAIGAITDHLSVLVNNAGIGAGDPDMPIREVSADGFELRLAVNHLAPFALTQDLVPLLIRGAPARVVNVASIGQAPIDFGDPQIERGYSGTRAYSQSKFAMIATGFVLARKLDPQQVTVNSLHPATYMPTKMVLGSVGYSIDSLDEGRDATLRLILDPGLQGTTGEFFDRTHRTRAHPDAHDKRTQQAIWDLSMELARTETYDRHG